MSSPSRPRLRRSSDTSPPSLTQPRQNSITEDIEIGTQASSFSRDPSSLLPPPDSPNHGGVMDWSQPLPIVKALAPRIPLIGKTALSHTLGLSKTSKYWTLRTALTVNVVRSFVNTPKPVSVSKSQHISVRDSGVKGKVWVAKVTLPVSPSDDDDVRQAIFSAIDHLSPTPLDASSYHRPSLDPVTAEWHGHRSGVSSNAPLPPISEADKYAALMKEVVSPTTTLYFHGGAYYLMDPASHRPYTSRLATLTTGRVLSVRYRLAPQHPFPAPLIDALVAYLSLLYPPPDSLHAPVPASHIVLAGDSAGGNLCTSLLLLLLTLRRQSRTVFWAGAARSVPLPSGIALSSPWMDITASSPTCHNEYAHFDYLPGRAEHPHGLAYLPDELWPVTPARTNLHVDDALVLHPLVSPLAARAEEWEGGCPVWIVTGWELLSHEDRVMAGRMAGVGVVVRFWEFEAMPHCFAMVVEGGGEGERCFREWAGWMRRVVEDGEGVVGEGSVGTVVGFKDLREREVDLGGLDEEWEVTMGRMKEMVRKMEERAQTLAKL